MYNASQRILVARELARSGWNIPAALNALRQNYATFDTISESTIRKMRKDPNFKLLLQDQGNILYEAQKATRVETEMTRERSEAQSQNPVKQRLAAAVEEIHELARANPSPRAYKVLLDYLALMRGMELPQPGWRPIFTERLKEPPKETE